MLTTSQIRDQLEEDLGFRVRMTRLRWLIQKHHIRPAIRCPHVFLYPTRAVDELRPHVIAADKCDRHPAARLTVFHRERRRTVRIVTASWIERIWLLIEAVIRVIRIFL